MTLPKFARIVLVSGINTYDNPIYTVYSQEDSLWLSKVNSVLPRYTVSRFTAHEIPKLLEYWLPIDFDQTKWTVDLRWPKSRIGELRVFKALRVFGQIRRIRISHRKLVKIQIEIISDTRIPVRCSRTPNSPALSARVQLP
ncbi:hypothetical protein HK100_002636 [Physocladia obscura]|uniref:Uncharacterized protein n=1 Tax=Physocladia obscura TaxID=109957 RepID=A0AAD5SXU6_9FUNG|nr:hypothetical protein HK100_002636 [Physocladia obscura]